MIATNQFWSLSQIAGVACLFIIFFFESICYPVIFSVATADLGVYNKLGGGLIAAGVSGGAVWPAMQTAVSEAKGSSEHISMLIPMAGFVPLAIYGLAMWMVRTRKYNGGVYSWKVIHPPLETAVDANLEESYESTGIPHTGAAEIKEEAEYKENKY
jgi:FHS family L-fucose permease-like MFS transporter